ncbi:hypothetical protein [Streptomyces atriruber]|nr:hypothetical protein [Streptomyces atriruber]
MSYLITLAFLVVLFLAMPFLGMAFNWYCRVINRLLKRRKGHGS